jgi:hypothetical protein
MPVKLILGADAVLARLLDERKVSRAYTPLHLSEVIQSRAHCTDGSINLDRVERPRRDECVVLSTAGVEVEHATPDPLREASKWKILDAIDANCWALRWAGYISDDVAYRWSAWLVNELLGPDSTELFKLFYLTCSWRIAFAMRNGTSFDAEAEAIMKDDDWTRKTKEQIRGKASPTATTSKAGFPRRSRSRRSPAPRGGGRGQQNRPRSRSLRNAGPPQKELIINRSKSRGGTQICRNSQKNKCKNKGKGDRGGKKVCPYSHECTGCGKYNCVGQLLCKDKKR